MSVVADVLESASGALAPLLYAAMLDQRRCGDLGWAAASGLALWAATSSGPLHRLLPLAAEPVTNTGTPSLG